MAVYGKAEARRMLPDLVARARAGEEIPIGMRGVPEAKLVSYLTPILSDGDLATLARGLGESQAYKMLARGARQHGADTGGNDVLSVIPDNLAADVVKNFMASPSNFDFAAEFVTSLALTTHRLYDEAGREQPSIDRLLTGISISAGEHPALYEQLVAKVMPKVVVILRHVADAADPITLPSPSL